MTASDKTKDGGSSAVADTHRATVTPVVSGHTPGPWRVNGPERHSLIEIINDDYSICEVFADLLPSELPAEANARLIAAAPDLLEAALAVEALWEGDRAAAKEAGLDFDEEQAWASPVGVIWKQLRAAISKATGDA